MCLKLKANWSLASVNNCAKHLQATFPFVEPTAPQAVPVNVNSAVKGPWNPRNELVSEPSVDDTWTYSACVGQLH